MYKLIDIQQDGCYFADEAMFKSKKDIVEQLTRYHNIDFSGVDDKDNNLTIEKYFKFYKINTTEKQLNFLLEWGSWELERS